MARVAGGGGVGGTIYGDGEDWREQGFVWLLGGFFLGGGGDGRLQRIGTSVLPVLSLRCVCV